jgi:hypothetical protein
VVPVEPVEQARPILSARASAFTGFPDVLGVNVTVHAIPFVDLEGGVSALVGGTSAYGRGGPAYLFGDWRDEKGHGLTGRISALFGYKWVDGFGTVTRGFNFAGAVELTRWRSRHFGVTIQLAGGGTFDPSRVTRKVFPDVRLSVGLSF